MEFLRDALSTQYVGIWALRGVLGVLVLAVAQASWPALAGEGGEIVARLSLSLNQPVRFGLRQRIV